MPHPFGPFVFTALTISVFLPAAAMAADTATPGAIFIAVDPAGSDDARGDVATGAVRSLVRAQALAREYLATMAAGLAKRAAVRVQLAPGNYVLGTPLEFTSDDGGTADAPVIYEAQQAGTAVISGGVELTRRMVAKGGGPVVFAVPSDDAVERGGGQLFVNGRRATLARQPDSEQTWFVQAAAPQAGEPAGRQGAEAFKAASADFAWLRRLSEADRKRAIVHVYHAWTTSQHRIAALPAADDTLLITPRAKWPFLSQGGASQRYFVENVEAALDAGGEWLRERDDVRYIPRGDDRIASLKAVLPQQDRLVVIQGERDRPVQHLRLKGLAFAHARHLTPPGGFVEDQAATTIGAAIEVNHARHFVLEDCRISATGGWGVWLRASVRNSAVRRCTLTDLGAGGIKVGLEKQAPGDASATGDNEIFANRIDHTGLVFPGAPALWIGQSWDNRITRNTIHDTTYTGISAGWSWGYAEPTSGRNVISGNLLYNIGRRSLADLGGIYTLGRSPGTVVSKNIIRAVRGYSDYGAGAWGIYADEGSSDMIVEGNVVIGTDSGGFRLHYGKNIRVKGNLFAQADDEEVHVARADAGTNLLVEENVLAPATAASGPEAASRSAGVRWRGNSTRRRAESPRASAQPVDIQARGPEAGIVAGALAAWWGADDAAVAAGKALPVVVESPTAAIAPAVKLELPIAGTPIGKQPAGLTYEPRKQSGAIRVEADADAPGGKCLALNDSDSFEKRYEPFAFATLTYGEGTTVAEFSVKASATAVLVHEWRDSRKPYQTGPSLRIAANGVTVNGQVIAPFKADTWATYRITASPANWTLEILDSAGKPAVHKAGLAFKDAGWRQLRWLGFIADGAVTGRACLARVTALHRGP
ncbi:MAG: right-handed parallel beta-helix repeat-containing protein [Burkholderiales bacterium]|nr:right-handed parallel beta-helix repeat-containing protein [Burkholderiales bacterium]